MNMCHDVIISLKVFDMISNMAWDEDQQWESEWWGDCLNTFAEEAKQLTYASRMGLVNEPDLGRWPYYNLHGRSVLDIGGGPVSLLLKTHNRGRCVVADPCEYPDWIKIRYDVANVEYVQAEGEELDTVFEPGTLFDEAWIYNVLQHTHDPEKIVTNARKLARTVRLFEWIDIPPMQGHPQELKAFKLATWLGDYGKVEDFRPKPENGCDQVAFYGVFDGLVL